MPNGVSTATVRYGASTATVPNGASTATVPNGVSTATVPNGVSTATVPNGVSTATVPNGVSTATVPNGVSTATVPNGVSTATVVPCLTSPPKARNNQLLELVTREPFCTATKPVAHGPFGFAEHELFALPAKIVVSVEQGEKLGCDGRQDAVTAPRASATEIADWFASIKQVVLPNRDDGDPC